MEKTSTPFIRKSAKRERPSQRIIDNILNYSKTMQMVTSVYGRQILLVNN